MKIPWKITLPLIFTPIYVAFVFFVAWGQPVGEWIGVARFFAGAGLFVVIGLCAGIGTQMDEDDHG